MHASLLLMASLLSTARGFEGVVDKDKFEKELVSDFSGFVVSYLRV